jgi:2-keto-4-pentenoate hydratase/2-oxohepta-3-ene-1,7-dioic acid hydratase in catechol pathway
MRLATLETDGGPRVVGVSVEEAGARYVPLQAVDAMLPGSVRQLLARDDGLALAAAAMEKGLREGRFIEGRLLAPVPDPGKVICIGLNYRDHAVESGAEIPSEPVCFSKFSHTVIGPGAAIELPAAAKRVDYEAELVVVIGRRGKNIPEADASSYVAGYMNGHDVSARDWQIGRPGGQWLLGKTPDTVAPTGPWLVTADEIADPQNLDMFLDVNGERCQTGSTKTMIFPVAHVVSYLSQFMALEPGDVITTGTPPGVGLGMKPQRFLKDGDEMRLGIAGLGEQRQKVVGG